MRGWMKKMHTGVFLFRENPKVFFTILRAKIKSSQKSWPKQPVKKLIRGIWFEFDLGYDQAMSEMYFGYYEAAVVEVMKKFLKPGGIFLDVGANIGYLSAVAMGLVGLKGQVHSFEPIPEYFTRLRKMVGLNQSYHFTLNECALGHQETITDIYVIDEAKYADIGLSSLIPGFLDQTMVKKSIPVPVRRLDTYLKEKNLPEISLIKLDTEGYEFPVLRGMSNFLSHTKARPPIICEVTPRAYPLLGFNINELTKFMEGYHYRAFQVLNNHKRLNLASLKEMTNVLFLQG